MQLLPRRLLSMFLSHRVYRCAQLFSLTAAEVSCFNLQRVTVAGAPINDDDLVPAEYFDIPSMNPNSQQQNTATATNSGEHGSGRLCFCL
jgi:hypothetical protein